MVRSFPIVLLVGLAILSAACSQGESDLPRVAKRQLLLIAPEDSRVVSAQLAPDGVEGWDTWCVVTEGGEGKERWLVTRTLGEENRDVYGLAKPSGPQSFDAIGCTNWDG